MAHAKLEKQTSFCHQLLCEMRNLPVTFAEISIFDYDLLLGNARNTAVMFHTSLFVKLSIRTTDQHAVAFLDTC